MGRRWAVGHGTGGGSRDGSDGGNGHGVRQGLDVVDCALVHDRLEVLVCRAADDGHDLLELVARIRTLEQRPPPKELGHYAADRPHVDGGACMACAPTQPRVSGRRRPQDGGRGEDGRRGATSGCTDGATRLGSGGDAP